MDTGKGGTCSARLLDPSERSFLILLPYRHHQHGLFHFKMLLPRSRILGFSVLIFILFLETPKKTGSLNSLDGNLTSSFAFALCN